MNAFALFSLTLNYHRQLKMTRQHVIGLLCGSFRGQNGTGIISWLESRLHHLQSSGAFDSSVSFQTIDTSKPPFPLGPLNDNYIPAMVQDSSQYPAPAIAEWSRTVKSLSGLVIISPQYNWGYPGELKNAFDHIFNEWKDLPVAVVTYGGHGGGKAGLQLRQVLEGGMKTQLVSQGELEITLPKGYIAGTERVGALDAEEGGFLHAYQTIADAVLLKLVKAATSKSLD